MRIVLAICLCALPPIAMAADEATLFTGAALYDALCFECHGPTATEGEAGDIRGLPASTVSNATQGFEMMPAFDLDADEIRAITAWLANL